MVDVRDHDPEPDDDAHKYFLAAIERAAKEHGDVALILRNINSHAPPTRARDTILDALRDLGPHFLGAAVCVPTGGIRAAAFRTFASAGRILAGVPIDVRADLEATVAVLAKRTSLAVDARAQIDAFFAH